LPLPIGQFEELTTAFQVCACSRNQILEFERRMTYEISSAIVERTGDCQITARMTMLRSDGIEGDVRLDVGIPEYLLGICPWNQRSLAYATVEPSADWCPAAFSGEQDVVFSIGEQRALDLFAEWFLQQPGEINLFRSRSEDY
jgi:hypothetical protein